MEIESKNLALAKKAKKSLDNLKNRTPEFNNFLKGFPTMIAQNGLMQTIAFIQNKAKIQDENNKQSTDQILFNSLINEINMFSNDYFNVKKPSLLQYLLDNDDYKTFIFIQETMIIYSEWLKRFALAFK